MDVPKLQDLLIKHEGLKLRPYRCTAGRLTIGVGRNLELVGISNQEAMYLLSNDIEEKYKQLQREIPCFLDLSDARQMALIDMAFMGIGRFRQFSKLIAAIESGNYDEAAAQMLDSDWAKQVGNRAIELSEMMKNDK